MVITREYIDEFVPKHERSSCDDGNLNNAWGGWDGLYDIHNGQKTIHHPRCTRCYLLAHVGEYTQDLEFEIVIQVNLVYKGG